MTTNTALKVRERSSNFLYVDISVLLRSRCCIYALRNSYLVSIVKSALCVSCYSLSLLWLIVAFVATKGVFSGF